MPASQSHRRGLSASIKKPNCLGPQSEKHRRTARSSTTCYQKGMREYFGTLRQVRTDRQNDMRRSGLSGAAQGAASFPHKLALRWDSVFGNDIHSADPPHLEARQRAAGARAFAPRPYRELAPPKSDIA